MHDLIKLQPVILCGGVGSRLWPLSRSSLPKQFLKIFNGKCLFELTLERLEFLENSNDPIIISSAKYRFMIENILAEKKIKAEIILEPESKNTAAAIFFSSYYSDKNTFMLIMPSDHFIQDIKKFSQIINSSIKKMPKNHWLTFGIIPQSPSSEFGHIKIPRGKHIKKDDNFLYKVEKFLEKPNLDLARDFFLSNQYLFNSGIFLVKREKALESIKSNAKEVFIICNEVVNNLENQKNNHKNLDCGAFYKIPSISIDYAVLEKEKNILCCQFNSDWSDVGSWDSYFTLKYKENNLTENLIQLEGKNNILPTKNRLIATVGIDDLFIVDTKDATLITKKNNSEGLKVLYEILSKNKSDYTEDVLYEERPWGSFEVLFNSKLCKVKKINVQPGKRLSLQYHLRRSEHWFIISGKAKIKLDDNKFNLEEGNSIDIPQGCKHYIENAEKNNLVIIEIQMGDYFGEDDIIRLDDPFKRF